jgi:hypothetical protein
MSSGLRKRSIARFFAIAAMTCFGATLGAEVGCLAGPANCSTGQGVYQGEGQNMAPGGDCIGCHSGGEGPTYLVAGTVMGKANDDDDCAGIGSTTVVITDAAGLRIELQATSDGNFFYGGGDHFQSGTSKTLKMPYTAKVVRNGQERAMVAAQSDGDCASCHTAEGANGAPGRIVPP